jgi:branched-chain amino acid transport system ATP-binding protein
MTAILETRNLGIQFGGVVGASEISISVDTGEVIGVIGANGAGKTTLMRTVMGFLPIDKGEIRFQDHSLTQLTAHSRARIGIGYMPEDRKLVPTLAVEENILLSFWATKNPKLPKRLPWVYEMIPEVTEFSARKAMDLSGGQQKLVALARALFCGTKLLLLDDPEYFGIDLVPKSGLPTIIIPTTAGTGSEVTPIAILSDHTEKLKKGIISQHIFLSAALLDPELTLGLPADVTAATGMDALIHAVESFTSKNATTISDMLARQAMQLIAKNK